MSPPGNLHASTIVRLGSGDPPAPTLTLAAGVALEEVASIHAPAAGLRLKWPNDLMAGTAKLAGILLERAGDAVVIGFGVNLAHAPDDIARPATSLAGLGVTPPTPEAFLIALAESLARWVQRWRGEGLEPVRRRWLERAHPIGTALATTLPAGRTEGLFDGLEPDGALRLRHADGQIEIVRAGDVILI